MPSSLSLRRFWVVIFVVVTFFVIVAYQLLQLSVIHQPTLLALAKRQNNLKIDIPPVRGQIYDRHGKELATSLKIPSIYAVPRMIGKEEKKDLAKKVSVILGLDLAFVQDRLSRDKAFIWLKRKVSFDEAEKIRDLEHPGFGMLDEYKRFYPQGDLLSQVLGFVNVDNEGLEGIELQFNQELQGRPGMRYTKRDALGREIKAFEIKTIPAINGHQVYLTIDQYLQYLTERALHRSFTQWKAIGASAIVMEAKTGKILAIANRPNFDPNHYTKSVTESRRNRALTDMYEPGSIFKIVTAAGALNENKVTLDSTFHCENGAYRYLGNKILHDVHPYGKLTFPEVVIKSSNIGTVKIAALMGPELVYQYIKNFGFGAYTGVDLPGEAPGFVRPPSQWSKTTPFNIPIGHEVMVTLTQMAAAMAVVANGGDLVQPYIIDRIEDEAGVVIKKKEPVIRKKVIRSEVARQVRDILVKVVDAGTGKQAAIKGIPVGGKTGTAQKVLPGGRGYSHSSFVGSFIGFAPADDPLFVMAVMVDDPRPMYYGGVVAAPVFKEVMETVLLAMGYVPKTAEVFEPANALSNVPAKTPIALQNGSSGKAVSRPLAQPGR